MKRWLKLGLVFTFMLSLLLSGCSSASNQATKEMEKGAGEKKDIVLTFGVTPWTSTVPPTEVAKALLEDMGYKVELQKADAGVVYTGLAKGDIDIFMDAWLPDMHKNYMDKYGDKLDDTAVSYPNGELGWVVPSYMKNINSIEDLKGKENLFDGKVYGIEEGAGMTKTSRELIKGYGLNIQYQASSEAGMLAQAKRIIAQEKPILFLGWRPHSMFAKWDLKVLKDEREFFKTSEVHVITSKDLQKKAPEAYEFLSKWSIPVEDVENMILKIDEGANPTEVAKQWIKDNPDKVNKLVTP